MNLVEKTAIPTEMLPIAGFRDHLRLGTGFGDDGLQDPVLESCLRAALASCEAYCAKAILAREFLLTIAEWRDLSRLVLPLAPVVAVTRLAIFDRAGHEAVVPAEGYRLIRDDHRPLLISAGYSLPRIPLAGRAEVGFSAGYAAFSQVPADMAKAVLMLTASFYEARDGGEAGMPDAVVMLLSRHRPMRLGGRS
ncbi:head-tail connector protein [Oceaniglobus indicus]|uniref:head-tail connector protein n=1 Tax=Oceaniglobus indicus TaxID=2047749 RepID=UPI000C1A68C9|nr:hypothetical protein [Oceaniglobus indicus]